jgi:hypothetical protein
VYGTLDGGRTFSRFLLFNYATTGQHDFMLCDFKKNEVRENFDEILSLPMTNGQDQDQAKAEAT